MKRTFIREILSPAHGAGFAALAASTGLFFIRQELAAVPLVLFLLLCAVASFLPRVGFFLPVISRGRRSGREVALTFDDGPDPDATPLVLDLLDRYRLPAAFFVAGVKAERYPALIRGDPGTGPCRRQPLLQPRPPADAALQCDALQ